MTGKKNFNKFLALVLSIALVFGVMPTSVFAEDGEPPIAGSAETPGDFGSMTGVTTTSHSAITVTAFEPLDAITAPLGTAEDDIALPETLSATAEDAERSGYDYEVTVESWNSESYNPDEPDTYEFTPGLALAENVTLADGVTPPVLEVTVKAPETAGVVFTIPEEALYLDAGVAVTDEMLLAGVSAVDKNGVAAAVTVSDIGGLERENPQPKGEPGEPLPYTITYKAGETTATRDCYVTAPPMALAGAEAGAFMIEALDGHNQEGWSYDSTSKILTITVWGRYAVSQIDPGTPTDNRIAVTDGAEVTLTLNSVNISLSSEFACALDMRDAGASTLTLSGNNTLKSAKEAPGIYVPANKRLTINGSGSLGVTGGNGWPGIGRNDGNGNIDIQGGVINTTGSQTGGAGIGGGVSGAGGEITISGGTVTATGGYFSAGIGGGLLGDSGGKITISGGTVNARGDDSSAGIGGGTSGAGGEITISGGKVNAWGGPNGAGIGGGSSGAGGEITVSGSAEVSATGGGGVGGAGIGGGGGGAGGTIAISGGTTAAVGGVGGAGIGGGGAGAGGTIAISGGTLRATGDDTAMDIGSGAGASGLTVHITGGSVYPTRGVSYIDPYLPTSEGDVRVWLNTLTLDYPTIEEDGIAVTAISYDGGTAYGSAGVVTTNGGKFYAWLPESNGNQEVQARTTDSYYTARYSRGAEHLNYTLWPAEGRPLIIEGWANPDDYAYENDRLLIRQNGNYRIKNGDSGTPTTYTVAVAEDVEATITLAGVNIDVSAAARGSAAALDLHVAGPTTVNLEAGSENFLKSPYGVAGIYTPWKNNLLTFTGQGSLESTGGSGGAGIGRGDGYNLDQSGRIEIQGGVITALGGYNAAGIGGNFAGLSGDIVISGGTVTATGNGTGNDIGHGTSNPHEVGSVTITGGSVNPTRGYSSVFPRATNGENKVYLNALTLGYPHAEDGLPAVNISYDEGSDNYDSAGVTTSNGGKVFIWLPMYGSSTARVYVGLGGDSPASYTRWWQRNLESETQTLSEGTDGADPKYFEVTGDESGYNYDGGSLNITRGGDYTIKNKDIDVKATVNIKVSSGDPLSLTLAGINIETIGAALDLSAAGETTLILADGAINTLRSGPDMPGIYIPGGGNTVTFTGPGSLEVYGGNNRPGIGRNDGNGHIVINGGTITATGGGNAAGIGGGIVINGGTVTATGKDSAMDIGPGVGSSDGTVQIAGGSVNPTRGASYVSPQPTSDGLTPVYLNTLTLGDPAVEDGVPVAGISVGGAAYPAADVAATDGKVFIWLPESNEIQEVKVTADNTDYRWGYSRNAGPQAYTLRQDGALESKPLLITRSGGGYGYLYDTNVLTLTESGSYTIKNANPGTPTADRILVSEDVQANITLDGVNIDVSEIYRACALDLSAAGNTTITLSGANTLKSGGDCPGIYVPNGNKLTFTGSGSLDVMGGESWPGIGRSDGNGDIEIQSGVINATGGGNAAGIGGSWGGAGGNIAISGGTVTATGQAEMDIGPGVGSSGGTVKITGGSVNPTRGASHVGPQLTGNGTDPVYLNTLTLGDPAIEDGIAVTAISYDGGTAYDSTGVVTTNGGKVFLWLPETVKSEKVEATANGGDYSWIYVRNTKPQTYTLHLDDEIGQKPLIVEGNSDSYGYTYNNDLIAILTDGSYTIKNANPGTPTTDRVIVSGGVQANITLDGVNIDVSEIDQACALDLSAAGNTTITLSGANTLKSGGGRPGIYVPNGNKLIFTGSGSLDVKGGSYWSGIGRDGGNGDIEIQSGVITATGGSYAAGIGGSYAAGIGGSNRGAGGNIAISGGTVVATGGPYSTGIGGALGGTAGNISISGGTVTATTGSYGSMDIGMNVNGDALTGSIKITGGSVNPTHGASYVNPPPTSDGATPVYLNTLALGYPAMDNNVAVTAISYDGGSGNYPSGGTVTSAGGKVFLWLPESDGIKRVEVTANNTAYWENYARNTEPQIYTLWPDGEIGGTPLLILRDGGAGGYTYGADVFTITESGSYTIKNADPSTPTTNRVTVSEGVQANITLDGVNIDASGIHQACALDLSAAGTTAITLSGANTLKSGGQRPGIYVPDGNKLTFTGSGSLNVTGGDRCPGIGRGPGDGSGDGNGDIEIQSGVITATGGNNAAGIGGSVINGGGNIAISGGIVTATGQSGAADIGPGNNYRGDDGSITITGGSVNLTRGASNVRPQPTNGTTPVYLNTLALNYPAIEDGIAVTDISYDSGKAYGSADVVTADGGKVFLWLPESNGNQEVRVTAGGADYSGNYARNTAPQSHTLWSGEKPLSILRDGGTGGYDYGTYVLTITESGSYTISNTDPNVPTSYRIAVKTDVQANITLNGVNIDVSEIREACALDLSAAGASAITLSGSNTLKSGFDRPGIYVPAHNKIAFAGSGSLNVTGGWNCPGIGRVRVGDENIEIQSGVITATGGYLGAGIGGSWGGAGGIIVISGGTVIATGGLYGAGIGGNYDSGGNILIYGETTSVTATGNDAQNILTGRNTPYGNVFVAAGTLKTGDGTDIGNSVTFSANPASSDTVTATLPAPFNAAPFGTEPIELLSSPATSGKPLQVYTTFSAERITFSLDDYFSVTKTGAALTGGENVEFEKLILSSIAITTPPTKTVYTAGERFDTAGMVVTAAYSDDTEAAVTGYTVSPDGALPAGTISVTVSYTEDGVTETATQSITVKGKPTAEILNYDLTAVTYNGSPRPVSVTAATGITGLGSIAVKYDGNTTAPTGAGTYAVTVDIADGTNYTDITDLLLGDFTIQKAAPTADLLNYTPPATVEYNGNQHAVSVLPKTGVNGLGAITVKYNGGETAPTGAGTYTVTADIAEGDNYSATVLTLGILTINGIDIAAEDITVTNYTGEYDGAAHGISVTDDKGGTVTYSETLAGTYNTASPTFTDAGIYTVWFKVNRAGGNYDEYSGTGTVKITKANQTTPTITGGNISKAYGDAAFTLSVSGGESTGAYSYESSDANVATIDASGQVTITRVGSATLMVKKLGDSNYNDSASASVTLTVAKADQNAPGAPTEESKTDTGITLNTITGAEYRRSDQPNGWQDSPAFTGLTANTGYTFYARLKMTGNYNASPESPASATITTLKSASAAPAAPMLDDKTAQRVTLKKPAGVTAGVEYRQGTNGAWQEEATFSGLTPNTPYTFYMRLAATGTHEASPASPAFYVTTDKLTITVSQGSYAVTKVYNGATSPGTESGALNVTGILTADENDVSVTTAPGNYPSANAGNHSVTVSLSLTGDAAYKYELASGTLTITDAAITPAEYTYTAAGTQNIKAGSGLSAITAAPAAGTGANGETVSGTLKWYSDAERQTEAQDSDISGASIDQTVTLYWSFTASNANYITTAKTGSTTFTIVDGDPQSVSFPNSNAAVTKTYGDGTFTNAAVNSSAGGGAVTYSSDDEAVATVSSSGTVTILKAGTANITATAAAVPGTWAETTCQYTLTVNPKTLTAAMLSIPAVTYNGSAQTPVLAVKDGTKTLVSGTDYTAVLTPQTNAGTYGIEVTGTGNYKGTPSVDFVVNPKPLTDAMLSVTGTYTYSGAAQSSSYTVTDGAVLVLGTDYTSPALSQTNAGSYPFSVTGIGNYSGTATQNFVIGKANIAESDLTYSLDPVTYDGTPKPVTVGVSGKTGYGSVTVKYNGNTAVPVNAGDYTVSAAISGGNNFNATGSDVALSGTYTISKANVSGVNQAFSVKSGLAKDYTVDLTTLLPSGVAAAQVSGYAAVEASDDSGILTVGSVNGTNLPLSIAASAAGADSASVTVSFTSANYTIASATVTVNVTDKYPVKISGVTVTSREYNGGAIAYGGTPVFTNTINNQTVSLTPVYAWSSGSTPANAGDYTLTVSADGGTDHEVTPLVINFSITKANQTVTFPQPGITRAGQTETLTATATSGLAVTYASSDVSLATVTGGVLTLLAPGTVTVTASQAGDANRNAAADVTHTVTVLPAASSDAGLAGLTVSAGTLSPAFNPAITNYTASVANEISSVTVTAVKNHGGAVVTGDTGAKALSVGENTFTVTVTAEDGITVKTYTLTVTRAGGVTTPVQHTVRFNLNGGRRTGGGALIQTVEHGGAADAPTVTRDDYRFDGWDSAFNNVTSGLTVNALWTYTGGRDWDRNPSRPAPSATAVPTAATNTPAAAAITLTGKPDANGYLTEVITGSMVSDVITNAETAAKQQGRQRFGVSVGFTNGANGVKSLEARFDAEAIALLESTVAEFCEVSTGIFRFNIDRAAISELSAQTSGIVTFSATPVALPPGEASAAVVSRPVFDFTVKDATGKTITSYGEGSITRGISYTAAEAEKPGNLIIVKIVNGMPQYITNSSYKDGWMIWSGDGNSVYGVAYKASAPEFTDTSEHWAREYIDFAVSRGLLNGTSTALNSPDGSEPAAIFSPNAPITRADFLTALGKLSGADMNGYKVKHFSDVPVTNPAMPYIEWAFKNGIAQGTGGGKFAPDTPITREAMAVMIVKYAKATGYTLPVSRQAVTVADSARISANAKAAVKAVQQAGVIASKTGKRFDPLGNITRGEAAAILHRFVELSIDEGTARGWVQNDSGERQYINESGKAVTGWQTIDGSRYFFDANGVIKTGWVLPGGQRSARGEQPPEENSLTYYLEPKRKKHRNDPAL